jgi:uncharacterized protein (DUF2235 family)
MYIIGEDRPIINKSYTYFLRATDISYNQVVIDNTRVANLKWYNEKPEPEPQVTWKLYLGKKLLDTRTSNAFKFVVSNQKYTLIATIKNKEVARTTLHTLGGKPAIKVFWQDDYGQKIGNKTVGYLDKVYLKIKTSHIPVGDTLSVTIYEDEKADGHGDSSIDMSTYITTPVNKNGYAEVYFNNLQGFKVLMKKHDPNDRESEHEYYAKISYDSHLISDADTIKDTIQLKVKNQLWKLIDPPVTNMPAMVGEVESVAKEKKDLVNFTFGIFLDGTLNNMYNTEVRFAAEGKKVESTSGLALSQADAKKIVPDDLEETSFENDLSNPAVLYKNYIQETTDKKQFAIYIEGIGSNTAPKKQGGMLAKEEYKKDDVMQGPAFGMGSSGIMDNVRKAIVDAVKMIKVDKDQTLGTITFDVFGFSRGAAAARHFVHVVTHAAYKPKVYKGRHGVSILDLQDNQLHPSYEDKTMPPFGVLGQLLQEKEILTSQTKVEVRFVGIYDTVPHHGLFQWNDIKDLGLDNVNKANYVVHMVAADEHRANFSLVDISSVTKESPYSKDKKKGGIELYYPGVHCDVGGAYEEGKPNNALRIDSAIFSSLEPLRWELIKQGWFKENEITIKKDYYTLKALQFDVHRLEGKRARLSNQYSYIPLHLMAEFCEIKEVPIKLEKVIKFKNFKENTAINGIANNVAFLKHIKEILHYYTFKGGKPLIIRQPPKKVTTEDTEKGHNSMVQDNTRVVNDIRIDVINDEIEFDELNKDLRFLRNHYLHWNSTYGVKGVDLAIDKNYPRILNGKRERHVR